MTDLPDALPHERFVPYFRAAAPYIHAFRGRTFVLAFGGEVIDADLFVGLTHDFNLLAALGVRLVLVHGARPQMEARLAARGAESRYVRGMRVTDEPTMQDAKEANGRLRTEIEALLSMGLPNSPMAGANVRVTSGNFVVARPIGVVDGTDMQYTGEVRKVHAEALIKRLDDGELVLLSSLGYSPTGEVFNLTLEDVAVHAAVAIRADKLIFLMDERGIVDARGTTRRELTVSQAEDLLAKGQVPGADGALYLPFAIRASRGGVQRVHLVSETQDGALLAELFTHDGVGTLLTADPIERVRMAQIDDVGGILRLIEPLEADGTLVKRSRELLEIEIGRFTVLEHDGVIVGCAALYPLAGAAAGELACLAVAPEHRGGDAGDRLLDAIEKQARVAGIGELFVLTTRAAHWFVEQGFVEVDPAAGAPSRQQMYNWQRRSKVLRRVLAVASE